MRRWKQLSAVAALVIGLAPATQAQVNDQTAEQIRLALKVWIGQQVMQAEGTYSVDLDGKISVVPDGTLYRVTLPAGRATVPNEGTLHFGEVAITLTPLANGWYDATWRVPDSFRVEPFNRADVLVSIGDQSGQGVFAPEFELLMDWDARLETIEVVKADSSVRLSLDSITADGRSNEVSSGVYDQQTEYRLSGMRLTDLDSGDRVELSAVEITARSERGRLAEMAEFQRRANALTMGLDGAGGQQQIGVQAQSLADLIESSPALLGAASVEARHGTLSIYELGEWVTLAAGSLTLTIDGLDQGASHIAFTLNSDGATASDPEIAKLLPNEAKFRLALVDLPNSDLVQLGVGTLRSMATNDPALAVLMASGGLQQALTTAGSAIEIGPIRLASDIASIDLEGTLRPDTASPYGVVGEVDMVATGLDVLIAEAQNAGGDPQFVQTLTLLQSLGAQAPSADGRSVRTYAFRIDNSGAILLNGADIMPLLGGTQQ